MRKSTSIWTCSLFALGLAGHGLVRAGSSGLEVGSQAPNFFVNTYNPQASGITRVYLDKMVGKQATDRKKVLVLSFFNIDCKPCRKELPFLQRLHEEYAKDGLAIIAVNCDYKPEKIEQVTTFLREFRFTFPVLKDRFRGLQRRYAVGSFPTMFILDSDGKIADVRVGYNEESKPFPLSEIQRRLGVAEKSLSAGKDGMNPAGSAQVANDKRNKGGSP